MANSGVDGLVKGDPLVERAWLVIACVAVCVLVVTVGAIEEEDGQQQKVDWNFPCPVDGSDLGERSTVRHGFQIRECKTDEEEWEAEEQPVHLCFDDHGGAENLGNHEEYDREEVYEKSASVLLGCLCELVDEICCNKLSGERPGGIEPTDISIPGCNKSIIPNITIRLSL